MNRASASTQALLLHYPRCGQAFVEMLARIGHHCAADPRTTAARRRLYIQQSKTPGDGREATR